MLLESNLKLVETYLNEDIRAGHGCRELSITKFTVLSPSHVVFTALGALHFERISARVDYQWRQDVVKIFPQRSVRDNAELGASSKLLSPCTFIYFST